MKRNKWSWIAGAVMALGTLSLAPACVFRVSATPAYVVDTEPPPPRTTEVPAPRAGYVWVQGRWEWRGNQWTWMDGHWQRARGDAYAWRDGYWERRGNRYHWIEGHWEASGGFSGGGRKQGGRGRGGRDAPSGEGRGLGSSRARERGSARGE